MCFTHTSVVGSSLCSIHAAALSAAVAYTNVAFTSPGTHSHMSSGAGVCCEWSCVGGWVDDSGARGSSAIRWRMCALAALSSYSRVACIPAAKVSCVAPAMCPDMCTDMCTGTCMDICINMCPGMCPDTCPDMVTRVDTCTGMPGWACFAARPSSASSSTQVSACVPMSSL